MSNASTDQHERLLVAEKKNDGLDRTKIKIKGDKKIQAKKKIIKIKIRTKTVKHLKNNSN